MTTSTQDRVPAHLRKYVTVQIYEKYTAEDQAVWRYILRQLSNYLSVHAHSAYSDGLKRTGISIDRIPYITDIDASLQPYGWGAVAVSGFIPPAAFMEFQSLGILPIACDMRTKDHLLYTPAPDIVHEAAGHAPMLILPEYSAYLRKYAEVARKAILSKEDLDQYEAIRILSDIKESPDSSPSDIQEAEAKLNLVNSAIRYVSEGGLLGRMNWWTAEYGLVGDLRDPKIFGAGLLSSLGESRACLDANVKKIPLSIDCVEYSYDITEPQPQLFVIPYFSALEPVLEQLANRMAYRRGGTYGLDQAILSQTVTTVELNSGVQISGVCDSYLDSGSFLKFVGPCQLSMNGKELSGHGRSRHSHGYSTPLGLLRGENRCLSQLTKADLSNLGIVDGRPVNLIFESGITVKGDLTQTTLSEGHPILLTFKNCMVKNQSDVLFDPSWGEFDLVVGSEVKSAFGGPADRLSFGETEDFVAKTVPRKNYPEALKHQFQLYAKIAELRKVQANDAGGKNRLRELISEFAAAKNASWLIGVELMELAHHFSLPNKECTPLEDSLELMCAQNPSVRDNIQDGLRLSHTIL